MTVLFGMGIWAFKSDDYIGGSSKHQPYAATPLPVVGKDLQDDAEAEAYRLEFEARYDIQDNNQTQDNSLV